MPGHDGVQSGRAAACGHAGYLLTARLVIEDLHLAKLQASRANPALRLALIRRLHVYVSVFVAPTLIFFALTGALQTFRIPDRTDAPIVVQKLARVHRDDVFALKPARPKTPAGAKAEGAASAEAKPAEKPKADLAKLALQWFFTLTSVAIAATAALGLWMALAHNREKAVLWVVMLAGIAAPLAILAL